MEAWKESEVHNANLLRGYFTRVGVAVVAVRQNDGSYVNYIAMEFA